MSDAREQLLRAPTAPQQAAMAHQQAGIRPNQDDLMAQQARSPAYTVLNEHGLLSSEYRVELTSQIPMAKANSSRGANVLGSFCCCFNSTFVVAEGKIRLAEDGKGGYFFYGPGVHWVMNPFMKLGREVSLSDQQILHGNLAIITVPQGFVGYAMDRGQPLLLAPGMHTWESNTIIFQKHIDLSEPEIKLGPYTLVTVDEGYSAVTQNNGQQAILPGGNVYLLTHRNWKFEKFMSEKIQTDTIEPTLIQTADNVLLSVGATVTWRTEDVPLASRMAADTMYTANQKRTGDQMPKLRNDVLKQALASLSAFIGGVRYSDSFAISTAASTLKPGSKGQAEPEAEAACSPLFDEAARRNLSNHVAHCNEVTLRYGVRVQSVNIISAMPKDDKLITQLAAAAVAAAEAEKQEIAARGQGKATLIAAEAQANAARLIAQGHKDAAEKLQSSELARDLERVRAVGAALGGNSTLFFGASAGDLGALMANPKVISR